MSKAYECPYWVCSECGNGYDLKIKKEIKEVDL